MVYFSEKIYIRLMYWLNNNLEKHMLLKKSSGMQTAWQLITSHNFNEFGNVVVVYNLDFLHSKYLVCAIFLAFFFLFWMVPNLVQVQHWHLARPVSKTFISVFQNNFAITWCYIYILVFLWYISSCFSQ